MQRRLLHDKGHLGPVLGKHHGLGRRHIEDGLIAPMLLAHGQGGGGTAGTQTLGQRGEQGRRHGRGAKRGSGAFMG